MVIKIVEKPHNSGKILADGIVTIARFCCMYWQSDTFSIVHIGIAKQSKLDALGLILLGSVDNRLITDK